MKILKLKEGESISVINSNNGGVFIKNKNNILYVENIDNLEENIYIKDITKDELTSFILTCLLENNSLNLKKSNQNCKLITKLLENQFNIICGNNYNDLDIKCIKFQAITYYEK